MRKIVLSVVACCAVIAIVPASALAHGRHHRHHHRAHHARIHHWGNDRGGSQNQAQNAGTVQSFTGGVLTIALSNGQTVSGQVTGDTEIRCETADTSGSMFSHDRDGGDNSTGDDDQGQGDDDNNASCSSSDLTAGAVVRAAELRVSSAGAVWDKVDLVTQSSQTSGS